MRTIFGLFSLLAFAALSTAQDVGIGTATPIRKLHVASSDTEELVLENTAELNTGVKNGIIFSDGLQGNNGYKYTGAIRTIGTDNTTARLGLFTYASSTPNGLFERLTILDNGKTGINNTNPTSTLSVNGSGHYSGNVGIHTEPVNGYSLAVVGASRYYNDVRIDGILNPNNALSIGNSVAIEGALTVNNGNGVVRSVNSTQMKTNRRTAGFNAGNFAAGATLTSAYMGFGEHYSSVAVYVGNLISGTGDWAKILIVPFDIDTVNDRCRFKLTNTGNTAIDFTGSWEIILIGN